MNKLLSANFARLWKNKVFWIGTAAMFIWTALVLITEHQATLKVPQYVRTLDVYFFKYALITGGLCAVFTSLFVGTDYGDGTIRNKIIIGHTRKNIYLSNMTVCVVAGLVMSASSILAILTIGVPLFGWFDNNMMILVYLIISMFMITAFVSVYTLTSMLNQNKASAVAVAFLVFLAILLLAGYCYNKLSEPKMTSGGVVITTDNGIVLSEEYPNPYYVSGNIRAIYEFVVDFLPSGQSIIISSMEVDRPLWMLLYSLIITTLTTITGIFIFKRKNLR
ncbi:MAG: hypothetical protein K0S76_2448 [Herbinix sp.]|jgi:hypothetical protein|nr:hypothetical protein [Herbinix sp.]